jgi:hypothetical protein
MNFDSTTREPAGAVPAPSFLLDDLPVDVFDVGGGLTVESLTGGHGMTEAGASCGACTCPCHCSCTKPA